jgi:iron complex transport system substrate-binding protein
MRVVTLLPSATEIVYALGVEPVGVSEACDYPEAARDQPSANRSRIDPSGTSSDINEQVAAAENADGVYDVDREVMASLDPDLIITQGVCDVCAVDHVLVADAVAELGLETEILTLDIHSLDGLFDAIDRIGAAIGRGEQAAALASDLRDRIQRVKQTAATADSTPTVAVLDWLDPVMVAGHWVPELIDIAGGRYEMADVGSHSRPREWQEIRESDPEVLIIAPCGFDVDQTRDNISELTSRPGFEKLQAVREDRAYILNGHGYMNRSGPRLVDTAEYVAGILHPDIFDSPPGETVVSMQFETR